MRRARLVIRVAEGVCLSMCLSSAQGEVEVVMCSRKAGREEKEKGGGRRKMATGTELEDRQTKPHGG